MEVKGEVNGEPLAALILEVRGIDFACYVSLILSQLPCGNSYDNIFVLR